MYSTLGKDVNAEESFIGAFTGAAGDVVDRHADGGSGGVNLAKLMR